jgi:hypothetical protein
MDFKEQLKKLREGVPAGKPKPQMQGPAEVSPSSSMERDKPTVSVKVSRPERAGRAPYNFVPLPGEPWPKVDEPPGLDVYTGLSGEIVLQLTALTPFFVRGMWSLTAGKDVKEQSLPYAVDGEKNLRIPGSTIRGMIRAIVEILGKCPIDPVDDQQLFFRAVGASKNPRFGNSFEPQAVAYYNQIGMGATEVKAGYLTATAGGWVVTPAKRHSETGRQFFKIRTGEVWKKEEITFSPSEPFASRPGPEKGMLVCSGPIPKKRSQWIMMSKDPNAATVKIPPADVEAYLDAGRTQGIKPDFKYSDNSKDTPCFYVEWEGHVSFGHTPFFRVPYRHTTHDAVPAKSSRKSRDADWDLAQAIFGRIAPDAKRGRVQFEDAILERAPEPFWSAVPGAVVLGSPKPTTYQHYLVQVSEETTNAMHWDGDYLGNQALGPVIRGHKLYWHRQEAVKDIRPADPGQQKVETSWKVPNQGAVFHARVRYENLREEELGALLHALELPAGCAHKLGMGKPLGLGSFRLKVITHKKIDRVSRYSNFLSGLETSPALHSGEQDVSQSGGAWKDAFRRKFYVDVPDIWRDTRLSELKALLEYEKHLDKWAERTRYLEFGRVDGRLLNEYLRPDKRRPLPPATQVLTDTRLPNDRRPAFEKKRAE